MPVWLKGIPYHCEVKKGLPDSWCDVLKCFHTLSSHLIFRIVWAKDAHPYSEAKLHLSDLCYEQREDNVIYLPFLVAQVLATATLPYSVAKLPWHLFFIKILPETWHLTKESSHVFMVNNPVLLGLREGATFSNDTAQLS